MMAPCPAAFSEKTPGLEGATAIVAVLLVPAGVVTVTEACALPAASHGTWKLICIGTTTNSGERTPFTRTSVVVDDEPRSVPNSEAMLPGATGTPAAKLAAFTIPPGEI